MPYILHKIGFQRDIVYGDQFAFCVYDLVAVESDNFEPEILCTIRSKSRASCQRITVVRRSYIFVAADIQDPVIALLSVHGHKSPGKIVEHVFIRRIAVTLRRI